MPSSHSGDMLGIGLNGAQLSEFRAVMKETVVMPSLSSSLILPRFSSSSDSVLSDAVSNDPMKTPQYIID